MYLVDTSVWIDFLRDKTSAPVKYLLEIFDRNIPFGLTSFIYQEILQGAASERDFKQLIEYFSTHPIFYPKDEFLSYQAAARLYFDCRRAGLTIRSSIDCLIAQIAIENDLILLHSDKDFINIKKVAPTLKLA